MKKLTLLAFLAISFATFAQTDSVSVKKDSSSVVVKSTKKPINKLKVWVNGVTYDADDIDVVCVWDDLQSVARFYYTLSDSTGVVVSSGNVELKGDKYEDYSTKPNHADRAVVLVMRELNLVSRPQVKK